MIQHKYTFQRAIFSLVLMLILPALAYADLANDLLRASDRSRGGIGTHGITWNIKIETSEQGDVSEREFIVKAKKDDAHVEATSPARNKGEIYLFNDRTMWFNKPSLKKPVSVSSRQRLTGQTANGDIASTHYSRDYNATIEKEAIINGDKMHVLLLKAKADNLTYDQIRYWVSASSKLAMRAEFLTVSGVPFKIGEMQYKSQVKVDSKTIPFVSQLTIIDAKFKENKSVITYSKPKIEDHPSALFNVNRLSR